MAQHDESPAIGRDAFICPTCAAYASQTWHRTELRSVPADAVQRPSEAVIFLEQLAFNLQALTQQGIATHVTIANGLSFRSATAAARSPSGSTAYSYGRE